MCELKRQIALLEVPLVGNDVPAIVCNQEFYGKVFLEVVAFGIVILLIYYFTSSGLSLDIALMGDKSLNGMVVFIIPTVNVSADSLVAKTTPYVFTRISDAEFRESLRLKRSYKYFEDYFAERTYTADYIPPHVPGWFNG